VIFKSTKNKHYGSKFVELGQKTLTLFVVSRSIKLVI